MPLRAWAPALVGIGAACALFAGTFQWEIRGAFNVWTGSTAYNHCFFILPLAAALLWCRRDIIASSRPQPTIWALPLVAALSVVWLAAALLDVLEAAQIVVVALFEAILLAVLGWRLFRALLAPLLFLFFLVPFGAFLVPALQRFTADFAAAGLALCGIPVFADGFVIEIPEGSFEVAEACAGLRFLVASIVFGCFFATVVYRSKLRRSFFVALSVAVPVVANGLRALGLIAIAHIAGSGTAVAADHVLYGWVFFTLVMLLLIIVGTTFADRPRSVAAVPAVRSPNSMSPLSAGAAISASLLMAVLGPAYFSVIERASAGPLPAASLLPPVEGGWKRAPAAATDWHPLVYGTSDVTSATYRDGKAIVTEFLARYRLPTRGNPFTRSVSAVADPQFWRITQTGRQAVPLGDAAMEVNSATLSGPAHSRVVWWFYIVDGEVSASTLRTKFLQARAVLLDGARVGAYVLISTDADDAASTLTRFITAMRPLSRN